MNGGRRTGPILDRNFAVRSFTKVEHHPKGLRVKHLSATAGFGSLGIAAYHCQPFS
jgi:hypothetical protein